MTCWVSIFGHCSSRNQVLRNSQHEVANPSHHWGTVEFADSQRLGERHNAGDNVEHEGGVADSVNLMHLG